MSEINCDHELYISQTWAPNIMDSTYADVTVDGTCEKCGAEWTSQYTWDVTKGTQTEDGVQLYECDECRKENMKSFAVEGEIHGGGWPTHFCSQACHDEYYKDGEEE